MNNCQNQYLGFGFTNNYKDLYKVNYQKANLEIKYIFPYYLTFFSLWVALPRQGCCCIPKKKSFHQLHTENALLCWGCKEDFILSFFQCESTTHLKYPQNEYETNVLCLLTAGVIFVQSKWWEILWTSLIWPKMFCISLESIYIIKSTFCILISLVPNSLLCFSSAVKP